MISYENRALARMLAGDLVLCMGLRQARTPDIALMASACGFDSIYVDMEHSPIGLDAVSAICIAATGCGVTPLVRVPGHDLQCMVRALDGGAQGIIVPHVEDAGQARALVEAAKYPPMGHRSVMGSGPSLGYEPLPLAQVNELGNRETLLVAMLETPRGIANADEIAAVAGIDMLLIGSNDLCTEMGIPGQLHHPALREAFESTAAACRRHGKFLGIGGVRGDIALQRALLGLGARMLIAGSDVTYLMRAAAQDAKQLRDVQNS
ncbi:2-keto-3-deoxy-L-rhamnonate aldolase [Pigmentiphaga humi]|uniref:2-keto-3-deoxy-L-rhamnonate aldolase n=1 Tax=Pigmentiphaga humi TaxID=2478468 RepID=A0A3P4B8U3_9BURK|nr:aldolase/citrate lyase family protein [Pigmentiphaga humi]VCU71936.1 2-keto-3-deoxy-L-rhamnonate aldolase [Pigmentiphaga humi]